MKGIYRQVPTVQEKLNYRGNTGFLKIVIVDDFWSIIGCQLSMIFC
jgi:hypothetical protein